MATSSSSKKDISRETTAAAEFWGQFVPESKRLAFQYQLAQILARDFQKHWHESEPHRGSAFRSIKCDGYGVDSKLVKVMNSIGVSAGSATFPASVVMWVNPGEVRVRYDKSWSSKTIYTDSESPARSTYHPLALKLQVEPTTILCSDTSDRSSSDCSSNRSASPMSSPPNSPVIPASDDDTVDLLPQMLWKSGQTFVPRRSLVVEPASLYAH